MSNAPRSRWFLAPRTLCAPRLRLICFAHAGAGASVFHPWAAPLAAKGVEVRAVQYPGRESRWGEPLFRSARAMADALAGAWSELGGTDGVPVVFYGHSMGGLIALELARRVSGPGAVALGAPLRHLVVGGRNPPHVPRMYPPIHHLGDESFLGAVAERYGNLPAALLADQEMRELITPVLKADFELVDEYVYEKAAFPLEVPLSVFGGEQDPFTASEALAQWERYSVAGCTVNMIPAGHFFHQDARELVWGALDSVFEQVVGPG